MDNLGVVKVDSTIVIDFDTRLGTGAAAGFSAALALADFDIYKDGSATQRTSTAGWTLTEDFDTVTGLNQLSIDLSDNTDAGFYAAGSVYKVTLTPDTETLDSVTVAVTIGKFVIESTADQVSREFRERAFRGNKVVTTTGNGALAINCTEVFPSTMTASDAIGQVLIVAYEGGTYAGLLVYCLITAYAVTNQIATVVLLNGKSSLPENVAAGDWIFPIGVIDRLVVDAIKAKTDPILFDNTNHIQASIQAVDGNEISQGGSDPASAYGVT